jgi:hypothetical protein
MESAASTESTRQKDNNFAKILHEDLYVEQLLSACNVGKALTIPREVDAAAVSGKFVKLFRDEAAILQCCRSSNGDQPLLVNADGMGGKNVSAQDYTRLQALLKLLAAWHAWCVNEKRFLFIKQGCMGLRDALRGHTTCRAARFWQKYQDELQALCAKAHGVRLDLR